MHRDAIERSEDRRDGAVDTRRTPGLILGPYFPLDPPTGAGADLWHGSAPPAGGRRLRFTGRVRSVHGDAVAGACVELWHADPAGRYRHPSAPEHTRVDPAFAGYGVVHTDPQGRFEFRSVVPGAYVEGTTSRAPHLHLQVTGRFDRLVTQAFLPGHALTLVDPWFAAVRRRDLLVPTVCHDDPLTLHVDWTLVLQNG